MHRASVLPAASAEVEVDEETGVIKVLRLAHAYDVGFAINPLVWRDSFKEEQPCPSSVPDGRNHPR